MEFEFASLSSFSAGSNSYKFELTPTADEEFLISEERNEKSMNGEWNGVGYFVYESISNWMVYHFHDTGELSPMRRSEIVEDYYKLRGDAANIAPFLLHLKNEEYFSSYYKKIIDAVRLVIPFFDDFRLDVRKRGEAEKVRLSWSQKGSDFPMQPYHLSGRTLVKERHCRGAGL